ncbi:golgin candidate 2 [Malania oleifera]|uniref:golgin candidate 2 n=1 Tax=Malania oleifera TaxID=397392 RepID=UPI0025ADAC6A|nr:golgin candidate 2 [Malania oleifera]
MAGWISSKLKVAETFLQQIDQQAAESLGKSEKPHANELNYVSPPRSGGVVPLKDQLKKRTPEADDVIGKLRSDPNFNLVNNCDRDKEISKPLSNSKSITDSDWTELLSSANQSKPSTSNRVPAIRGVRKDGRKQGSSGSNLLGLEARRNQKSNNNVVKLVQRSDIVNGSLSDGKLSDGEESRISSVELQTDGNFREGQEVDCKSSGSDSMAEPKHDTNQESNGVLYFIGDGAKLHSRDVSQEVVSQSDNKNDPLELVLESGIADKPKAAMESSVTEDMNGRSSSASDAGSDSDSDSGLTSDSESDHEKEERKKRREKIMAERVAAKAVGAIKEHENVVARLEGEKQSLEKILEERAKQQAEEASELQTSTMEMIEAVEKEKEKHNNTRMEVLARLAKLETANADLARSLVSAQWNLEVEVNRVAELRQQLGLKQASHEELKRRISHTRQTGTSLIQLAASKGVEFEQEILEAECSFITDEIGQLQDKAKKLEADIEMTRKEMENPTEVEVELKRRLGQLTDHLIQKQAQVEAISSEKAMLLFRIEAISRLLEENKSVLNVSDVSSTSSRFDLESGKWDLSNSNLMPQFEDRIRSGKQHLGSLLRQLDAIFSAGAVFLRKNSTARLWSVVYLVCLHVWVIYILLSHSQASDGGRPGAVISLENINNTAGI